MSEGDGGEASRRRRLLDALGFQLSLQFWVALFSSIIFGVFALLVWITR